MRMDNTRCTAGLVFLGSRPLDLPFLATRLERVLGARGFETGVSQMVADDHLKMGLGAFELHLNALDSSEHNLQADGMHPIEKALGGDRQPQASSELSVSDATMTLTVTIIKLPSDLPSLREAERSTVTAHSALALATLELAQVMDPDFVQWLQPDMMLQTSSFLSVLEKVTPRRVTAADTERDAAAERRKRPSPVLPFSQAQANRVSRLFPDIDVTCERLETQTAAEAAAANPEPKDDKSTLAYLRAVFLRQDTPADDAVTGADTAVDTEQATDAADDLPPEPSTVSRLATWAVSLVVALISLPVGLALMMYNLFRGEDLRLALTALALTGLFTGLVTAGIAEKAITALASLPVLGELMTRLPV